MPSVIEIRGLSAQAVWPVVVESQENGSMWQQIQKQDHAGPLTDWCGFASPDSVLE